MSLPPLPDPAALERLAAALEPLRSISRPVFVGDERVPKEGPLLLVGNHTLFGVVDAPHLLVHFWKQHGAWPRTLGHHEHWSIPGWSELVTTYGVVDGTRENLAALFESSQRVMVFPGGSREAFKRKGEEYQLVWGDRLGFARMAIRHGVPILPFAALGADEVFEVVRDSEELRQSPFLGSLLRGLKVPADIVPPLAKGRGPLGTPSLQRLYFHLGAPIDTRRYGGDEGDEAATQLREEVQAAFARGLEELRALRGADPDRRLSDVFIRWVVPRVLAHIPGMEGATKAKDRRK
jgi:1-acyl-sn-glycerol-3-phosphate acyltransferase